MNQGKICLSLKSSKIDRRRWINHLSLIAPPDERGHGEAVLPALDDVALRPLLPEAELGAAVVGGDEAARGHAAALLAGQHGDRVAQADVPVSEEAPLATAVFVESGERS